MLQPALGNAQKNHATKNARHLADFSRHCPFPPALARIFFGPAHRIKQTTVIKINNRSCLVFQHYPGPRTLYQPNGFMSEGERRWTAPEFCLNSKLGKIMIEIIIINVSSKYLETPVRENSMWSNIFSSRVLTFTLSLLEVLDKVLDLLR